MVAHLKSFYLSLIVFFPSVLIELGLELGEFKQEGAVEE